MKAALAVLLLSMSVSAAAQTADDLYKQACGPLEAKFDVERVPGKPPATPEPGKALVYFIQEENWGHFITRVGLDGSWVGVVEHASYIFVSVAPGEHHACAATLNRKHSQAQFVSFTAEAGGVYYYRVRGTKGDVDSGINIRDFGPVDRDEARYLIASDPQSKATPVP